MIRISVDVEADGPCPPLYSMLSIGAVVIESALDRGFYRELRPISDQWQPDALKVSGFTRVQAMAFEDPKDVMLDFAAWLDKVGQGDRVQFVSDNAGFDWQFVNYYFHAFVGSNPFGHSSVSLTWLYKGFAQNLRASFQRDGLRTTKHDHNALNDAKGNAEAFLALVEKGLRGT